MELFGEVLEPNQLFSQISRSTIVENQSTGSLLDCVPVQLETSQLIGSFLERGP